MGPTSAFVLFAVVWFMVLFVVLPIGRRTQGDEGEVVPGTMPGSPVNFNLRRTMLLVTAISVVLWGILAAIILSGVLKISELNWI